MALLRQRDIYVYADTFYVPDRARWAHLRDEIHVNVGTGLKALSALEEENASSLERRALGARPRDIGARLGVEHSAAPGTLRRIMLNHRPVRRGGPGNPGAQGDQLEAVPYVHAPAGEESEISARLSAWLVGPLPL